MEKEEKLIRNTSILAVGTILSKVLVFSMIPFFSRWLSAEDYGSFDLFCTYIMIMIPFITLSCSEAVFRFTIELEKIEEQKKIITNGLIIILIGSFVSLIVIPIFFLNNKTLLISFIVLLLCEVLNHYFLSYLRGIKKLKVYTISNLVYILSLIFFVTLYVYILKLGLKGMIYGYASGYLIANIYIIISTKFFKYINLKLLDLKSIKELITYSAPLIPNHISWWIVNVSDRIIISSFIGMSFNGIYAIANKIPAICTTLFSVFHIAWQESASEAINDKDKDIYFTKILNNLIPVITTICICILSVNFIVFNYVLDIKYIAGYYQVPILIASVLFTTISQFLGGIFIGMKETKKNGFTTVISAIVNIVLNLMFIKKFGLYAASLSTLISFIVLCIIRFIIINKSYQLKIDLNSWLLMIIFLYFIIMQYINITFINYINIIFAVVLFIYVNWPILNSYLGKISSKTNIESNK